MAIWIIMMFAGAVRESDEFCRLRFNMKRCPLVINLHGSESEFLYDDGTPLLAVADGADNYSCFAAPAYRDQMLRPSIRATGLAAGLPAARIVRARRNET